MSRGMQLDNTIALRSQNFDDPTLQLAFSQLQSLLDTSIGIKSSSTGNMKVIFALQGADGYSVSVVDDTITFTAATAVEILYAVYTFAERFLGFCFLRPGKDIVHPMPNVTLPDGMIIPPQKPALATRGLIQEFPFDENSRKMADWMAKNKLNYLLVWMKYYDLMPQDLKEYYRVRGITIECGHHNFEYFIPADKYYKSNPEYFAIIDGKRIMPSVTDGGYLGGGQLCTTNPGLRKQLLQNIIDYCRKNPEVKAISLIPNDGFGWCECETCRQVTGTPEKGDIFSLSSHVYKAQDLYHSLIAYISSGLKEQMPDITLSFAAYINYIEPAKDFKLKDKTAVHFANYWRCVNHNINDAACPINSKYVNALDKWRAVKSGGRINMYEYYMGINLYISMPMIHHEQLFDEVQFYSQNGIDGLLTQFQFNNWTAYGTNYYLMAKAAYSEDKEAINKLYSSILPQAPDKIKAFYDCVKHLVDSTGPCHIPYPRALLNRTDISQYQELHRLASDIAAQADDEFFGRLVVWTQYLVKFKQLFDDYTAGKESIRQDINAFLQWITAYENSDIFVAKNVKILIHKWLERIDAGQKWYHYGIDWEDEYIKIHDKTLNTTTGI